MANAKTADQQKRLDKAKVNIILDHPFVATLMLSMPIEIKNDLYPPSAATNGRKVFFHPGFIDQLTDGQLVFALSHEVMHPMFMHNTRRNNRHPLKWNIAADYVINQILVDDNIGEPIPGMCLDKKLYDAGGGITDSIYNLLPDMEGQVGMGVPGSSLDNCMDADGEGNGDEGSNAELEADWKDRVVQAATIAKMCGKLSAGIARIVGDLVEPKVPWQDLFHRFMIKQRNNTRSWARPNRRFLAQGLIMPSVSGEMMGEVVFAVDCSGSISNEILNEFASEVRVAQEDTRPVKIHIIYFDSKVCHYDEFEQDDEVKMAPHGGGGTAFSPVFRYMEEHNINPVCCVFLTDLYCSDYGEPPDYPVLWVTNGATEAPWGEVVKM